MYDWNMNQHYSKNSYPTVNLYPTLILIIFLTYISSYNKAFTQEVWFEIHTLVYFTTSPCREIIYLHGQSTAKLMRVQTHTMLTSLNSAQLFISALKQNSSSPDPQHRQTQPHVN